MRLRGAVCVVTGASSGIGWKTAEALALDGGRVCAVARRGDRLRELLDELPSGDHTLFVADVTERDEIRALAGHVEESYGRCDVLVNNAGISAGGPFRGEESLEDLDRVFATNFFGAVACTAALLPLLEASAPAHVVNVASIAGRVTFPGASAYCGSKFALVGWSECARYDLRPKGVHVSLIEPGPLPTEGFPQRALVEHPIMRRALTTDGAVARAIVRAITRKKAQRVIPRWYYLAQVPRLLTPGLYRFAAEKVVSKRVAKGQ